MDTYSIVASALDKGNRVLLLGQSYLEHAGKENPLFAAFAAVHSTASPYTYWLNSADTPEARAAQFLRIDRTVQVDDEVARFLKFPWICVYSSCIDSTTRQQLEIPNERLVNQITSPGFDRIDHNLLTLIRLFGTIERPTTIEQLPPADAVALRRRRTDAAAMLAKLPEIVTPAGRLFVEGWNPIPGGDWLRPRDLDKALVSFLPGQVLIFGISPAQRTALEEDDDFGELVKNRTTLLFEERLVDILAALLRDGLLRLEITRPGVDTHIAFPVLRRKPDPGQYAIPTEEQLTTVEIAPLEWRRLTQALTILDTLDPTEPLPESKDQQYYDFRTFLANGFSSPPWKWLRHFAFRRSTLDLLRAEVYRLCSLDTPQDHVVILSGPSGSGKTILLQSLVLDLRRSGLGVIYMPAGLHFVDYGGLIDEFCLLLEAQSTSPVVVIFDTLERDETYVGLARYLASRGRKCLVIGSSFSWQTRQSAPTRKEMKRPGVTVHTVPLPSRMESEEKEQLLVHLERFIPQAEADLAFLINLPEVTDNYFFAVLYRSLPEVRRRIEGGIINEIQVGAERIQEDIEGTRAQTYPGMTLMEIRLREALQHRQDLLVERMEAEDEKGEHYEVKDALLLINAVMLASMVGQAVPVSLALRLIRNNFRAYAMSIPEDIIGEHELTKGFITLSARHQLEAEIWVRHRLLREIDKIELLRRLVLQIRGNEVDEDQSHELEFVVKLLQAFGPQGHERFRFTHSYDQLASIVEQLRARYKRVHPRLLLVASHAIREWVQVLQRSISGPGEATDQLTSLSSRLQTAEEGLAEAIEIVRLGADRPLRGAPRRMLATLETEQACILGVQIGSIRRLVDRESIALPLWQVQLDNYFRRARAAWLRALRYSEENFHALDTACWVSDERVQAGGLDEDSRAEALAHWSEALDRYYDLDIPPSQVDKRDARDMEFSRILGDQQRFAAVVSRLSRRGSTAAFALQARFIAREEGPAAARTYLEENCGEQILRDRTLIVLYFRLWWLAQTGFSSFFPEQRLVLNFNRDTWNRLRELCEARLRCEGEEENGTALFLEGCALMHLGFTTSALQVFDHLESLDMGGFRRARSLILLSDFEGNLRKFSGEYRGRRRGSNLLAWCDDLGINLPFNPAEHHFGEPREGKMIGPFYVAFNYRGPYVLPLYRIQKPRVEG